jgi:hypothetical protein
MFVSRLNKLVDNMIDRKSQMDPKPLPYETDNLVRPPIIINYTDSSNENGLLTVNNFFLTYPTLLALF